MSHIFISYSKQKDIEFARHLRGLLQDEGFAVWMDETSVDPGERWWDRIEQNIVDCAAFIVIMSPDSRNSDWVQREILVAENQDHRKPIFPVLYRGPMWFRLANLQYEDMQAGLQATLSADFISSLEKHVPRFSKQSAPPPLPTASTTAQSSKPDQSKQPATNRATVIVGILVTAAIVVAAIGLIPKIVPQPANPTEMPTLVVAAVTDEPPSATTEAVVVVEPSETPTEAASPTPSTIIANDQWTSVMQEFDGVEMVLVPSGCFMMGAAGEGGEQCFEEPFYIGRYEVTNAAYRECVEAGACARPGDNRYYDNPQYANYPAVYIDWYQALDYAAWKEMRLPTEAEWEYAGRGPDELIFPWGDEIDGDRFNSCDSNCTRFLGIEEFDDGYEELAPVGLFPDGESWVGALNMSGNVWEWTNSIYSDTQFPYPYATDDNRENVNTTGVERVLRGGSWLDTDIDVFRLFARMAGTRNMGGNNKGFRVALSP